MYREMSVMTNKRAKIVNVFVLRVFCVCGQQKPENPKLSPMADDAIKRGGIGGLGSLVYIGGYQLSLS